MSAVDNNLLRRVVAVVAPPFFEQGHERVFVASCCGRVLVVLDEVRTCRTCDSECRGVWVRAEELEPR